MNKGGKATQDNLIQHYYKHFKLPIPNTGSYGGCPHTHTQKIVLAFITLSVLMELLAQRSYLEMLLSAHIPDCENDSPALDGDGLYVDVY